MASSTEGFVYKVDEYVVLQNLQKTPEHNGKIGMVRELLAEKMRLSVQLLDGKLVNVKGDNMRKAAKSELKEQLTEAYDKLKENQIERILRDNQVKVDVKDKTSLVETAVEAELFPSYNKGQPSPYQQQQSQLDMDELIQVPGHGSMTRREMWAQADQLDKLTISQVKEQVRMLQSRSPQELRNSNPAMRDLSDEDIQAHIQQLKSYVKDPALKKMRAEAMRSGDFSKLNALGVASMDDDTLRRDANAKLELFRKDKAGFRAKYLPDQTEVSDEDLEQMFLQQANADSATLQSMRQAAQNGGRMDISTLSDEQLKSNAEMQLKMFKKDPKKFRKQMEDQNPAVKNMSDDEVAFQLETLATMDAKTVREMQAMSKTQGSAPSGPGAAAQPNLKDLTGAQLSATFKMQRDMFKRDPKSFRKMVPQMASLSDSMIEQQLNMMADMSPDNLKMYLTATSTFTEYISVIKDPLDKLTGGRGQMVLGAMAMFLLTIVLYFVAMGVFRVMSYLFPTTFGYVAPAAAGASAKAEGGGHGVQVEVTIDDDGAFFQENDDL